MPPLTPALLKVQSNQLMVPRVKGPTEGQGHPSYSDNVNMGVWIERSWCVPTDSVGQLKVIASLYKEKTISKVTE